MSFSHAFSVGASNYMILTINLSRVYYASTQLGLGAHAISGPGLPRYDLPSQFSSCLLAVARPINRGSMHVHLELVSLSSPRRMAPNAMRKVKKVLLVVGMIASTILGEYRQAVAARFSTCLPPTGPGRRPPPVPVARSRRKIKTRVRFAAGVFPWISVLCL